MSKGNKQKQTRKPAPVRRRRNWLGWLLAGLGLVVVIVLVVVGINRYSNPTVPAVQPLPAQVTADQAYAMYQNKAVFLDVRTSLLWQAGHITLSKSIPLDQLQARRNELPRNLPIVIVDDNSDLSPKARDLLLQLGFAQVTTLEGGIYEWVIRGLPFEGNYPI